MGAKIQKRIIYYTQKPQTPKIVYPTSDLWFNATMILDASPEAYLKWSYIDFDTQIKYQIRIFSSSDITKTPIFDSGTVSGSSTTVLWSALRALSTSSLLAGEGIYYWDVRVQGTTKNDWSDYSELGTIKIDTNKPTLKGVDIISPMGWNASASVPSSEIHSNSNVILPSSNTGYFVGFTDYASPQIVIQNESGATKTFWGSITPSVPMPYVAGELIKIIKSSDVGSAQFNVLLTLNGDQTVETTPVSLSTCDETVLTTKSEGATTITKIEFVACLNKSQNIEIRLRCDSADKFDYELRISTIRFNLVKNTWAKPTGSQYDASQIQKSIFIGGAETPPISYENYKFSIMKPLLMTQMPIGLNQYVDPSSLSSFTIGDDIASKTIRDNSIFEFSTTISGDTTVILSDRFITNAIAGASQTIKVGDIVYMQRSYDSNQRIPKNSDVFDSGLFDQNRSYFRITSIDIANKILLIGNSFKAEYLNIKYPYDDDYTTSAKTNFTFDPHKEMVLNDDGTYNERYITQVEIVGENFTNVKRQSTQIGTIKNELCNRWIAMRDHTLGGSFSFYPILANGSTTLTILANVDSSDFSGTNIDYYICGDIFVPTASVFTEDLTQAYMYIGAEDVGASASGIKEYGLITKQHNIIEAEDLHGNKYNYIDRLIGSSDYDLTSWKTMSDNSKTLMKSDDVFGGVQYKCYISKVGYDIDNFKIPENEFGIFGLKINTDVNETRGVISTVKDLSSIAARITGCYANFDGMAQNLFQIVYAHIDYSDTGEIGASTIVLIKPVGTKGIDSIIAQNSQFFIINPSDNNPTTNSNEGGFYDIDIHYSAFSETIVSMSPVGCSTKKYINISNDDMGVTPSETVATTISRVFTGWVWIDEDGTYAIENTIGPLPLPGGIARVNCKDLTINQTRMIVSNVSSKTEISLYKGWNLIRLDVHIDSRNLDNYTIGLYYRQKDSAKSRSVFSGAKNPLSALIPLNFTYDEPNKVTEIFVNIKDYANNISIDDTQSIYNMPSAVVQSVDRYKSNVDRTVPQGTVWLNNREKHPKSIFAITDLFPMKDNEMSISKLLPLSQFQVSTYPSVLDIWSQTFKDSNGVFETWNKYQLGAKYKVKVSAITPHPLGTNFFLINIDTTYASGFVQQSTMDFYKLSSIPDIICRQIVGSRACFYKNQNDQVGSGYQFNVVFCKTGEIFFQGDISEFTIVGAEVIIDTTKCAPTDWFTQDGIFEIWFHGPILSDLTQTNNFPKKLSIVPNIDYVTKNLEYNIDLTKEIYPSVLWKGYVWAEQNSNYSFYINGKIVLSEFYVDDEWLVPNNGTGNFRTEWDFTSLGTVGQASDVLVGSKALNRGWHLIYIFATYKYTTDPGATISISYKSNINDNSYYKVVVDAIVSNLPQIQAIDSTDFSFDFDDDEFTVYPENDLKSKYCLLGIIDTTSTGGAIITSSSSIDNSIIDYTSIDSTGLITLSTALHYTGAMEDYDTVDYYVDVEDIYEPYKITYIGTDGKTLRLNWSDSTRAQAPSSGKLRIGMRYIQVLSNSNASITCVPSIFGQFSLSNAVSSSTLGDEITISIIGTLSFVDTIVGSTLVVTDSTYTTPIVGGDAAGVWTITSYSKNNSTITIRYSGTTPTGFDGAYFRIRDLRDMAAVNQFTYIPLGQKKVLIPSENLIRNASNIYAKVYDYFGNYIDITDIGAISLKDVQGGSGDDIGVGNVIEFDIASKTVNKVTFGNIVYDCNQTQEVIGIFESEPISSPTGFSYWTFACWDEYKPAYTDVEFYVKTAQNETGDDGLEFAEYNKDAFGITHDPYTSTDYDIPVEAPTGINISQYTTDGSKNNRGEIIKNRWLQWKIVLKSSRSGYTPTVDNIRIGYSSTETRVIFLKNMTLQSNITKGFLVANVETPTGSSITFGINTTDELDFNKYQIIPNNEAFEVIEQGTSFRLAAKIVSSGSNIPKIYNLAFMYNTEDYESQELPNINL
jgi:hypothetical protein